MTMNGDADDRPDDTPATPMPSASIAVTPAYGGRAAEIGAIVVKNSVLTLLTLEIYRFWAKTRLRRYLWGSVSLEDDTLDYTGLAGELFKGFLIALAILVPIAILFSVLTIWTGEGTTGQMVLQLIYFVGLYLLYGVAQYRARRYRLSRTRWRGIRAGQTESVARYAWMKLGWLLAAIVTVGLLVPHKNIALQRYRTGNTWFGDRRFSFDGDTTALKRRWLPCWLLLIPTLGLSYLWYKAAELRCFAACTRFERLEFDLPVRGGELFCIHAVYYAIVVIVTVAFLATAAGMMNFAYMDGTSPRELESTTNTNVGIIFALVLYLVLPALRAVLVTHPLAGLAASRLAIGGEASFETVTQSLQQAPSMGEGLADALDVDIGI